MYAPPTALLSPVLLRSRRGRRISHWVENTQGEGNGVRRETVSGTLSPPRGLRAATWAAARPYREPRRWPVRVQPFPLRLSPGLFSGEPTGELHVTD